MNEYVKANQWLPIETAPKDGTNVLVVEDGNVLVASYINGYGWDIYPGQLINPTHWQPLPQVPGEGGK